MKWVSHKILSFSLVWLGFNDFFGAVISGVGSIFPDLVEGKDYESERWRRVHRTYTHCLAWWVLLLGLVMILSYVRFGAFPYEIKGFWFIHSSELGISKNILTQLFLFYGSFYFVLGWVLHILEDAISGRVPLWKPQERNFGIRLVKVGSFAERILVLLVFFCVMAINYWKK